MFTEAKLFQILDSSVKDISRKVAKIEVANKPELKALSAARPCWIYTKTKGDYDLSFALCADYGVLEAITRNMKRGADADQDDVKLYMQEFLNILFGHIVSRMNQSIQVKVFFDVPRFTCCAEEKPVDNRPVKFHSKYYYDSPYGELELETVYNE